jgi:hypothetical protein
LRAYESASTVNAAKIIAIQKTDTSSGATSLLIYATPEVGAATSAYEEVTATWVETNKPAVGGSLIDDAGTMKYIPAASFEAIYSLVTP